MFVAETIDKHNDKIKINIIFKPKTKTSTLFTRFYLTEQLNDFAATEKYLSCLILANNLIFCKPVSHFIAIYSLDLYTNE